MIEKGFKENSDTHTVQSINLPKETEFRMRLEFTDDLIRLKLEQGQAEIFGAEMTKYYWYTLPVCLSISVYTWRGCSIKLCFPKDKNIQSYPYSYAPDEENQNYFLANCFMSINSLKERALEELKIGSKVIFFSYKKIGFDFRQSVFRQKHNLQNFAELLDKIRLEHGIL